MLGKCNRANRHQGRDFQIKRRDAGSLGRQCPAAVRRAISYLAHSTITVLRKEGGGRRAIPSTQSMSHDSENFAGLVWFFDDRERPGSLSPAPVCRIETACDDDDGDPVASPAHPFEKIQPAHSRHVNIEDQTVAITDAVGGEEFPARAKYAHLEACAFE